MTKKLYTLHRLTSADPGFDNMVAVVHRDGDGFLIGNRAEAAALQAALERWLEHGRHDGEMDEMDERLGWTHIDIATAVTVATFITGMPVSAPAIRAACAAGRIRGAHLDGKTWRFPRARFLGWLKSTPHKRGRPHSAPPAS